MISEFCRTAGLSLAALIGLAAVVTWLNGRTLQRLVNRTQTASPQLWLARPGLWFHEAAHAVVGWLFGLRIAEFSLRANATSAGHVTFRVARHAWWQRLGLFWAAGAPVWGACAVILLLGKRTWWPHVAWAQVGWATLAPDWPWVLGWAVVTGLLSLGASLSWADFKQMLAGAPVALGLVTLGYLACWWWAPGALVTWWAINRLVLGVCALLVGLSALLAGLSRLL